ncbi:unnamed protein product [Wuchereria bancrofti]|uniref:Uncharacterized protein n=1 Tax=Wuchereria bancrofti TaxID=6293 RepID=A0A3P7DNW9_WUCBA|nr:unnamed protein product [Wuchereria bancrofti]
MLDIVISNFISHFCDNDLSETHDGHHVGNDDLVDDDNIEPPYSGTVTPTTTLRRAKESFLRQQNDIFKEYEEQVMVTGAGESVPINESDIGDEMPSGVSDMGEESRIILGDEELPDSSKEYIEFCIEQHSEDESMSSCAATAVAAAALSDQLTSNTEEQSIHAIVESKCITLPSSNEVENTRIDEFHR